MPKDSKGHNCHLLKEATTDDRGAKASNTIKYINMTN